MKELKIVKTEELPSMEYIQEVSTKNQIVLHHTVSAEGKYIDDWFKADKGKSRVAVAFVIDKDGTIFQLFDPKYWAYHIGKGSTDGNNRHSIGIEIVNEGPVYKRDEDEYYWWIDGNYPKGRYPYKGFPFYQEYRGFEWWASYTNEQKDSVQLLVPYLLDKFNINPQFVNTREYDAKYLFYKGIVMHVNLREDKTDLSPAFPLDWVNDMLEHYIIDRMSIVPKPLVLDIRQHFDNWEGIKNSWKIVNEPEEKIIEEPVAEGINVSETAEDKKPYKRRKKTN